jgi:hypothetical protein
MNGERRPAMPGVWHAPTGVEKTVVEDVEFAEVLVGRCVRPGSGAE